MKKLIYILLVTVFSMSCNEDLLDTKPLNKFSEALIWEDYGLAEQFVYTTYQGVIPRLYVNTLRQSHYGAEVDDISDNVVYSGGRSKPYFEDLADISYDIGWGNAWGDIRRCNIIIEKAAASKDMSEEESSTLVAEGKMLRGLLYWTKARQFGRFIIIDKVLTPEDDLTLPQSKTIKETYDFIIQDMRDAAAGLPMPNNNESRLNKVTAYAYLAEVALHGAAYLEDDKEKAEYYNIAKNAGDSLFALNFYSLDQNYGGMFNEYASGRASNEIIFAHLKSKENTRFFNTPMQYIVANTDAEKTGGVEPIPSQPFLGWSNRWPSVELINDYLITEDGQAKFWTETDVYTDVVAGNAYVSSLYENRDKRFAASVIWDSSEYHGHTFMMREGGNMDIRLYKLSDQYMQSRSGYFIRKGMYEVYLDGDNLTDYHHVLMRLGRATLNHAEVLLRLGETAEAIRYINMTRIEHGGLPALDEGLTEIDAWKWYKVERRVELFMENDRYWSLLRWGKEDGQKGDIPELNNQNPKWFHISADGKSFEIKDLYLQHEANKKSFSERRYLYPVPKDQMDKNPLLTQNPLW